MVGGGFEPPKATPTDLQSVPFDHSGTPPINKKLNGNYSQETVQKQLKLEEALRQLKNC